MASYITVRLVALSEAVTAGTTHMSSVGHGRKALMLTQMSRADYAPKRPRGCLPCVV
jgi:hypothetical protein